MATCRFAVEREFAEISDIVLDARVRAVRWDVVPWAMIFDLDLQVYAGSRFPEDGRTRAWLCFASACDVTLTAEMVRFGNGFLIGSEVVRTDRGKTPSGLDSFLYEFVSIAPDGIEFAITATDLFLIYGSTIITASDSAIEHERRLELLSDRELGEAVYEIDPELFQRGTT